MNNNDSVNILNNGKQIPPDGTEILPDGTEILPDGTEILPDGTRILPDGSRIFSDGTRLDRYKRKGCLHDYGFEPIGADYNELMWKVVDCSNPFKDVSEKEKRWTSCYPTYNPKDTGEFDDENKGKDEASLQCAFTKWNWDGDKPEDYTLNLSKRRQRRARRAKMKKIMKKICNRYDKYCPKKEGEKKKEYCDESQVCDDGFPNPVEDIKLFVKIIMESFDLNNSMSKKKQTNKTNKTNKKQSSNYEYGRNGRSKGIESLRYAFKRGLPGLGRLSKRQLAYGSRKLSRIKGGSRYLSKRIKKMRKNKKKN